MLGKIVDARGKKRNLHFRRTGIALRALVVMHNLRLLRAADSHRYILQP
jgi:hypothetical protein